MMFLKQSSLLALAACLGLGLVGCQPSDPNKPNVADVDSIAVTPNPVFLEIGGVQALTVTGSFSNDTSFIVTSDSRFVSSAPGVATVDPATGYVIARANGNATITATHEPSGKTATTTVTVAPLRVLSIAVSPAAVTLAPGATQALTVNATYNNLTTGPVTAGSTFVSSDPTVATVDAAGVVAAVAVGTANITATHTASGNTAEAAITVAEIISGDFTGITFDEAGVTYALSGFGGAEDSTVVDDSTNPGNLVARVVKSATAELWAGTTVSTGPNNSVGTIPFTATNTRMTVRVYSPRAGIPVRLKVEDAADPTHTVETEATITVANAWQTLTFNFANQVPGTAALNLAFTYNKVSIFFDFGTTGAAVGSAQTYRFDDVLFDTSGGGGGGGSSFTAITFDEAGVDYALSGFGGAEDSVVVDDSTSPGNNVARVVKSATAELWAGTTVSTGDNNSVDTIPFTATNTRMTVRVYSPRAGIPVRLKVEDAADPTHTVETEATITVANAWQTLTFDFANQVPGTAALNLAFTYNKVSIFFDFGTTGATVGSAQTYYFDDVLFDTSGGGGGGGGSSFTAITFDEAGVDYALTGFGGAEDSVVVDDSTNPGNKVARVVKSATAELWAGTTVSTEANNSVDTIPFTATNTRMTVRVYSPRAGIPVRLKVEDAADPTHTVETEATITVANAWQTLTFNFANQVPGTAALNLAFTYNKVSIFFDFGTTGATVGSAQTYRFDDVLFDTSGGGGGGGSSFTAITFDEAGVTYALTGFGGAEDSVVVDDSTNPGNNVARVVKSATAELWAGTTVSTGANNSVDTIPFTATNTRMTVRVYSPRAGIPVRLKVEDAADPTHTVETEATITVANAWQTLTFDFANPAPGTAALNLAFTYNKASIFFDFGTTGAAVGSAQTYYFDDVLFIEP